MRQLVDYQLEVATKSRLRKSLVGGSPSGKHSGAQALIKQEQPLALYVHCGAHCTNLITQKACLASVLTRDSLDWVHQLGVLLSQSGKFKAIHAAIAQAENTSFTTIKPLCPTRWIVRNKAITAVLFSVLDLMLASPVVSLNA